MWTIVSRADRLPAVDSTSFWVPMLKRMPLVGWEGTDVRAVGEASLFYQELQVGLVFEDGPFVAGVGGGGGVEMLDGAGGTEYSVWSEWFLIMSYLWGGIFWWEKEAAAERARLPIRGNVLIIIIISNINF